VFFDFITSSAEVEGVTEVTPRSSSGRSNGGGRSGTDHGAGVDIRFGKYAGKTLGEILQKDRSYVEWLAEDAENDFIRGKAGELLANTASS
jgi:hypothetical protein